MKSFYQTWAKCQNGFARGPLLTINNNHTKMTLAKNKSR